jgi:hypothetical protein
LAIISKKLKKGFLLILVTLFLLHSGVMTFVFDLKQYQIHHESQSHLAQKKAIVLTFKQHDFDKLIIRNNEFEYKGELYDIKTIHRQDKKITLSLIKDSKETRFLAQTKDYKEKNTDPKNKLNFNKYKVLFCLYCSSKELFFFSSKKLIYYPKYKPEHYPKRSYKMVSPPPEIA